MKVQRVLIGLLFVGLILYPAVGIAQAQPPGPDDTPSAKSGVEAAMNDVVPIQGRLTDENGNPLDGTYSIRFRIYDASTGGTVLCEDTDNVAVNNGLFNAEMDFCTSDDIDGRQLWLGVKVGSDAEMTPRQGIYAVPYAWGLRPGAQIVNTSTSTGAYGLQGESTQADGKGLYGYASSSTTTGHPIGTFGQANAQQGIGVFGYASAGASGGYGGFFANASASGDLIAANDALSYSELEFRVSNNGEVYADGNFHPGGADFAELLPAAAGLEPGDVLVIGPDGRLARSTEAYQPTVVGVYSTKPGIVGGGEDGKVLSEMDLSDKAPLAIMGVVPVKVSAENGPISPGDLLVASATPGHAMKADPNPAVGTVIGKALAGLDSGTGVIQVLVMLQ
jgi:hypothetical protein